MSGRKILIVNLTRFGDLLQTGPTIAGLKAQEPGSRITVVAERNFADVCEGLPGIDRIWPIQMQCLDSLFLLLQILFAWHLYKQFLKNHGPKSDEPSYKLQ